MYCYILDAALLKQALVLPRCRSDSASYLSHMGFPQCPVLSVMIYSLGLLSAHINLNSAVKTAGLPLLRAFVKWAVRLLLPPEPLQYPVIFCCLWPLPATQSFFTAVLRITLISHQSASINSGLIQHKRSWPFPPASFLPNLTEHWVLGICEGSFYLQKAFLTADTLTCSRKKKVSLVTSMLALFYSSVPCRGRSKPHMRKS